MTDARVRDASVKDSTVSDVIRIEWFNGMSGYPHQVAITNAGVEIMI